MRIVSLCFIVIAIACNLIAVTDPLPFSERSVVSFKDLAPEAKAKLESIKIVGVEGAISPLKEKARTFLKLGRVTLRFDSCPECGATLRIECSEQRYWEVKFYAAEAWVVDRQPSPVGRAWYSDRLYTLTLSLKGDSRPLFTQTTAVCDEVVGIPAPPPEIPTHEVFLDEVGYWVSAVVGEIAPIASLLQEGKAGRRELAAEICLHVGNPSARPVLEEQLKVEKNRAVKSKLKKALEACK